MKEYRGSSMVKQKDQKYMERCKEAVRAGLEQKRQEWEDGLFFYV